MQLTYPEELPISSQKERIIDAMRTEQVIVVAGDTGSGKTTQLPKMCLAAGRGSTKMIAITQPRRIAAMAMAERLREEVNDHSLVGYKIRFHDHTSQQTRIKFMTDGVLLAEIKQDKLLRQYDTIIIDEAHERSLNIDFLLGYLKSLLAVRSDLLCIIASATIDTEKFSNHFNQAPIIEVSGRTYPISYTYLADDKKSSEDSESYVDQAVEAVMDIATSPFPGDTLVFMPTERDIMDTVNSLRHHLDNQVSVLPLFGRLRTADQRKIFQPAKKQKIIVATNVAETSLTVPGIRYVVDTGLARIARYNVRARTTSLLVSRISQASCDQRAGRCGRVGPGTCIRLYSEADYLGRPAFTLPEIQRSNLAEVILQMIALKLGNPRLFSFIDPPTSRALTDGYRLLRELGALNKENHLTGRGRIMARLPLDPCISRIIIAGKDQGSLREMKTIAAALSIQDPRIRPAEQTDKADAAHQQFADKNSDFLSLLNMWDTYTSTAKKVSSSRLRKFCSQHFLSWQRMREWKDIREQINRLLSTEKGFKENSNPASYDAIHQAITCGFLRNIGQKKEKNIYQVVGGKEVMIFPGSNLFGRGGAWIVAADFVETSRLFARTLANIDERWLEALGGELCKYSWADPHWEKKTGHVVALETVTLFGLTIVADRKVNYGRINKQTSQEARTLFIRSALMDGNLGGQYPFLQQNRALVKKYTDMEKKLRRRDIVVHDDVLFDFYDTRLGLVFDRHTLNRFLGKRKNDQFLRMSEKDICASGLENNDLYRFPGNLPWSGGLLKLHYQFQPGHEADGVTAEIPCQVAPLLTPSLFEWLVPGLLEEKIYHLLKGLPKRLRRLLIPLPETAATIMADIELYRGSLYAELERIIMKQFQITIHRQEWNVDTLPPHLRMRFHLRDENNHPVFSTRSFPELLANVDKREPRQSKKQRNCQLPEKQGITSWDFNIPEQISCTSTQDKGIVLYYPALFINEKTQAIDLRFIPNIEESLTVNSSGLNYLYCLQVQGSRKKISAACKVFITNYSASLLTLGTKKSSAQIRQELIDFVTSDIFQTVKGIIPTEKEFIKRVNLVKKQNINSRINDCLEMVSKVLTVRRDTYQAIMAWAARAKKNKCYTKERYEEYQELLQAIVPPTFLTTMTMNDLARKPVYLTALIQRIERAEQSPHKDARKAQQIAIALERLVHMQEPPATAMVCREKIKHYLQMIEEFRVSVFAPELGTLFPVSEKRLNVLWKEIEHTCHSVE